MRGHKHAQGISLESGHSIADQIWDYGVLKDSPQGVDWKRVKWKRGENHA